MISDEDDRHRRLVELNVIETCINVFKAGVVQRKRLESMKLNGSPSPRIHALVYDPKTGLLTKLPINFSRVMSGIKHIYELYESSQNQFV